MLWRAGTQKWHIRWTRSRKRAGWRIQALKVTLLQSTTKRICQTIELKIPLQASTTLTQVYWTIGWRLPDSKRKRKWPGLNGTRSTIDSVLTIPQAVVSVKQRNHTHNIRCPRYASIEIRCIGQLLMRIHSNSCSNSIQTIRRTPCIKWVSINTKVLLRGQSRSKKIIRRDDHPAINENQRGSQEDATHISEQSILYLRDS